MKSKKRLYLHDNDGFTLIEMLVVVLIVGILGAISAPSWQGFLNRQRMNSARGELMNVLRDAQTRAQSRRQSVEVNFPDTGSLSPGDSPLAVEVKDAAASTPGIETILGSGEISDNFQLDADAPLSIQFDHDGRVAGANVNTPFVIKIVDSSSTSSNPPQSCVIVTTILGGIKPAN